MLWLIKDAMGYFKKSFVVPIKVHNRIIMACCLLHNFIRMEMPDDPFEMPTSVDVGGSDMQDYVSTIDGNPAWSTWRDVLAQSMFDEWRGH
ncbi:UNVERIFIED_CONTAM: hypothetical protein Slati_3892500 [Sesamum latifolium]|uniref:DDE Tnp4 domain-containing protein n=1 Tax=Sesamum latifolium TaxID=2727402 RepID=A0AAW2TM05_9LAMI